MTFRLSTRSKDRLVGLNPKLIKVVQHAITITKTDFGVTCGLRTLEEQRILVAKGASQTMKSKHIEGNAVDVVAYLGSRISWELNLYDDIAEAMQEGAQKYNVSLKWGAAWTINDISKWKGSMEEAMNSYVDTRRKQGRRPFIDAPHFELN